MPMQLKYPESNLSIKFTLYLMEIVLSQLLNFFLKKKIVSNEKYYLKKKKPPKRTINSADTLMVN